MLNIKELYRNLHDTYYLFVLLNNILEEEFEGCKDGLAICMLSKVASEKFHSIIKELLPHLPCD